MNKKLILAFVVRSPYGRRCPGLSAPVATNLSYVYGSVECPVHKIIGRKDYERFNVSIAVRPLLSIGFVLLVVIGTIDIQAAVVVDGCWVRTKNAGTDGVAASQSLVVRCRCCLGCS